MKEKQMLRVTNKRSGKSGTLVKIENGLIHVRMENKVGKKIVIGLVSNYDFSQPDIPLCTRCGRMSAELTSDWRDRRFGTIVSERDAFCKDCTDLIISIRKDVFVGCRKHEDTITRRLLDALADKNTTLREICFLYRSGMESADNDMSQTDWRRINIIAMERYGVLYDKIRQFSIAETMAEALAVLDDPPEQGIWDPFCDDDIEEQIRWIGERSEL